MDKIFRNYELRIAPEPNFIGEFFASIDEIIIRPPFTLEFDITKKTLSSVNVGQFRIKNLSQLNRDRIRFNISDYGTYRPIQLYAGYRDNLALIFKGNITQAWSVREGVDWVTQIECYDGGFAYLTGEIDDTAGNINSGTPLSLVYRSLFKHLPNVTPGAIGIFPTPRPRGNTYNGNTVKAISELGDNLFFIDSERAYALNNNEYIAYPAGIPVVNPQSGLLNTPILERTIVRFDMIFEPSLLIGGAVVLDSFTDKRFNGIYKLTELKHRGVISDAVCGEAITSAGFYYESQLIPIAQLPG